jgi:hypothetical protein
VCTVVAAGGATAPPAPAPSEPGAPPTAIARDASGDPEPVVTTGSDDAADKIHPDLADVLVVPPGGADTQQFAVSNPGDEPMRVRLGSNQYRLVGSEDYSFTSLGNDVDHGVTGTYNWRAESGDWRFYWTAVATGRQPVRRPSGTGAGRSVRISSTRLSTTSCNVPPAAVISRCRR